MSRLVSSALVLWSAAIVLAEEPGSSVPRYRFVPGQQITYRTASNFEYTYGEAENAQKGEWSDKTDWTLWVLGANDDGSFRLVIRQDQDGRSRVAYADVFADGRVAPNPSIQFRGHPGPLFPRLPKDASEVENGWSWTKDDETWTAKAISADLGFRFTAEAQSPFTEVYLSSEKATYEFDPVEGLIASAETAKTRGWGAKGEGAGTIERVGVRLLDAAELEKLAADAKSCLAAIEAYDQVLEKAGKESPEVAKTSTDAARDALQAAADALTHPDFKAELQAKLEQHEGSAEYAVDSAQRRAGVVGKPAPDFETTDLDGKTVTLADLRGKVAVLDFWYRGCGWCIKAMPQINALADDFAGRPVMILGMNTDAQEEDARFVVEKMGLKYPTLKAEGLPEKFGVRGFPTLIVIDQEGKVHDLHVGYSPTLRDDLGSVIRGLLEAK